MNNKIQLSKVFRRSAIMACLTGAYFYASFANAAICKHEITSQWDTGFVANISITNDQDNVIEGWNVNWEYEDATIASSWGAQLNDDSGTLYSASDLGWNQYIYPDQTIEFGVHVNKDITSSAESNVTIKGNICTPSPSPIPTPPSTPTPIPTPTPTPTPTPHPPLCGDSWLSLSISGLEGDDKIEVSWHEGWTNGFVSLMGNQEAKDYHFMYCGPIESFPPSELIILDDAGYSCSLEVDKTSMTHNMITCAKPGTSS